MKTSGSALGNRSVKTSVKVILEIYGGDLQTKTNGGTPPIAAPPKCSENLSLALVLDLYCSKMDVFLNAQGIIGARTLKFQSSLPCKNILMHT